MFYVLKTDAQFSVFDGEGQEFCARFKAESKKCLAELHEKLDVNNESPLKIHLAQGLARSEKMDWIIQKAVELGVNEITPLQTEFSEVRLSPERMQKKLDHWQGVIIHACEQSGRNWLPSLHEPLKFSDFLTQRESRTAQTYLLHPGCEHVLKNYSKGLQEVTLMIGPEGGFSDQEVQTAKNCGVTLLQLGRRVMRTETAGIAAMAAFQMLMGDFN